MIQLSEAAAIALHAMIYMANRDDKIISLKEISNAFKISDNHLSKVLQRLVKAGYLTSIKGPKGGFQIKKEKKNATFMEIYEVIEGKQPQRTCLFSSKTKECSCCIMGGLINKLHIEFNNYMNTHRINDFKL